MNQMRILKREYAFGVGLFIPYAIQFIKKKTTLTEQTDQPAFGVLHAGYQPAKHNIRPRLRRRPCLMAKLFRRHQALTILTPDEIRKVNILATANGGSSGVVVKRADFGNFMMVSGMIWEMVWIIRIVLLMQIQWSN